MSKTIFELVYSSLNGFVKNAVSGLSVAQCWSTSYILTPIADGGPVGSFYLGHRPYAFPFITGCKHSMFL